MTMGQKWWRVTRRRIRETLAIRRADAEARRQSPEQS
jgi:hypothetical protein